MTSNPPAIKRRRELRPLLGPAFLALAPLQFLAGDAILRIHHARPFSLLGSLGFLLVVTSLLVVVAGLGETGNLIGRHFSND